MRSAALRYYSLPNWTPAFAGEAFLAVSMCVDQTLGWQLHPSELLAKDSTVMMIARFYVNLAGFELRLRQIEMRHPIIANQFLRWTMVMVLIVNMTGLVIIPLHLVIAILHRTRVTDAVLETYDLSTTHAGMIVVGIVAMFSAALILAGFASSVVERFGERRWSLLLLAVPFACFTVLVFWVTASSTAMIGFVRGDNAILACFMAAWSMAIGMVCAIPTARTIAAWKAAYVTPSLPHR